MAMMRSRFVIVILVVLVGLVGDSCSLLSPCQRSICDCRDNACIGGDDHHKDHGTVSGKHDDRLATMSPRAPKSKRCVIAGGSIGPFRVTLLRRWIKPIDDATDNESFLASLDIIKSADAEGWRAQREYSLACGIFLSGRMICLQQRVLRC